MKTSLLCQLGRENFLNTAERKLKDSEEG